MVAKKFQNPEGGLNQAGRDHFKKTEGANLKDRFRLVLALGALVLLLVWLV